VKTCRECGYQATSAEFCACGSCLDCCDCEFYDDDDAAFDLDELGEDPDDDLG
jgi:hypothetical protein